MLHVTCYVKVSLTRHCIIPRKTDPPLRLNGNASFLCDFLYRGARFVRFLVYGYKSAISSTFPPVSHKVKAKVLISIYLQDLLKKTAKSGKSGL